MLLKKVLNENKPKLLTESKTYSAYSTIFKYNNAEYQREIAETCLDSKTSKNKQLYIGFRIIRAVNITSLLRRIIHSLQ